MGLRRYYVYILASKLRTLYIGVTNDLPRRVWLHKAKVIKGFTSRYNVTRLVYFEETDDIGAAIHREKQLKGWRRSKKIALIETANPQWADLAEDGASMTAEGPSTSPPAGPGARSG